MTPHDRRDDALAAEYALGTLRGSARLRFQRRMQAEPALMARVTRWQSLLSGLDTTLAPVPPPASVWKKITLSLPPVQRARATRGVYPWLAAAAMALLVLTATYLLRAPDFTPLAVLTDAQHREQWVVSANREGDRLSLAPLHAISPAADKSLELWIIPAGKAPVSLGLVDAQSARAFALHKPNALANATLAISLEPRGGSPTGQPTGPVLYSAAL
ncbi:anti-sigma factor [Pantoea sp. Mb-10]|uniref:anti-sigma factor n=1 Tax=unclassified Pantoea TaxID=2630326 RepID=UPI001E5E1022|nr:MULTISPECIES: anti-sigma factor [unclassified Pantoea]MCE0488861.1 anti-sigma factor [Pantoea sp. Mb-10]MCE0500608.1 anti-sigma factor [Pantoea sp. Pb-8]